MARRAAGGGTGTLVALVAFVILWVISTGLAILFYTQRAAAEQNQKAAVDNLAQWAKTEDQAMPQLRERVGQKTSVARQLYEEATALKNIVVGNPTMSLDSVKSQLAQAKAPEANLLGELSRQQANVADTETRLAAAEKARQDAITRAEAAEAGRTQAVKDYEGAAAKLAAAVDELNNAYKAAEANSGKQRTDLEANMVAVRDQTANSLKEKDDKIRQLSETISQKDKEIEALRPVHGPGTVAIKPHLQPDGRIATFQPGENIVYIDRGRANRVVPGLTFEVYDASTGVTEDEKNPNQLRGKATIEVVNVLDNTSTARIVRMERNKTIREGDIIANAVYDANMRFKFMVFGDFDIDNTGQASVGDRRRIETMIREWGALIAEQLSYDTDFVVLGQEPKVPEALGKGEVDPVKIARFTQEKQRFEAYQSLIKQASDLHIPVLNQNRFLQLVGYYKR